MTLHHLNFDDAFVCSTVYTLAASSAVLCALATGALIHPRLLGAKPKAKVVSVSTTEF